VRVGAHALLELDLAFAASTNKATPSTASLFELVLFDRSHAGFEIERPVQTNQATALKFTLTRPGSREEQILREIRWSDPPPDGSWRLEYRHGLLTLCQSSNVVGSADIGVLGVQVAGVSWIQRGGKVVCRQMTLRAEPLQETSQEDTRTLQEAAGLNQNAQSLLHDGKLDDAIATMRRASELFVKIRGEHHYDSANSFGNLATMLQAKKEFAEADQLWSKALSIHEETLGPAHPHTTQTRFRYGQCCLEAGSKEEARRLWRRCREDWQLVFGADYARLRSLDSKLKELQ